jgi:hypothetical protein
MIDSLCTCVFIAERMLIMLEAIAVAMIILSGKKGIDRVWDSFLAVKLPIGGGTGKLGFVVDSQPGVD